MIDIDKLQAHGPWVMLRRMVEEKTPGGILLVAPELDKPWMHKMEVLSVGEGAHDEKTGRLVPHDVRPGDIVQLEVYRGNPETIDGKDGREEVIFVKGFLIAGVWEW